MQQQNGSCSLACKWPNCDFGSTITNEVNAYTPGSLGTDHQRRGKFLNPPTLWFLSLWSSLIPHLSIQVIKDWSYFALSDQYGPVYHTHDAHFNNSFRMRVYVLKGIPHRDRLWRIERLKKHTKRCCCLVVQDYGYVKILVSTFRDWGN